MYFCLHLFINRVPVYYGVFFIFVHVCILFVDGSLLYMNLPSMWYYGSMHVRMFVCIVITYSKGKNQPGKVANPARGQLAEQGKQLIPCSRSRLRIWSRKMDSAALSRVSLLVSILRLNLVLTVYLTGLLPSSAAASIYYRYTLRSMNAAVHVCTYYVP